LKRNTKRKWTLYISLFFRMKISFRIAETRNSIQVILRRILKNMSLFSEKYFKHCSIIINCLYWEKRYPKLLSSKNIKENENNKLLGISDISCSLSGAIDVLEEHTTIKKPYFIFDTQNRKKLATFEENVACIVYQATPDLSANFSIDATEVFSNALLPFMKKLASSHYPLDYLDQDEIPEELRMATITSNGSLTLPFINIFRSAEENEKIQKARHYHQKKLNNYSVSLKFKGNLVISGFLKHLVYNLNKYDVDFEINYLKIGENFEMPSIFYIDLIADNTEILKIFLLECRLECISIACELNVIKHNLDLNDETNCCMIESFAKNKIAETVNLK